MDGQNVFYCHIPEEFEASCHVLMCEKRSGVVTMVVGRGALCLYFMQGELAEVTTDLEFALDLLSK